MGGPGLPGGQSAADSFSRATHERTDAGELSKMSQSLTLTAPAGDAFGERGPTPTELLSERNPIENHELWPNAGALVGTKVKIIYFENHADSMASMVTV